MLAPLALCTSFALSSATPAPEPYESSKEAARARDDGYRALKVVEVGPGIVAAERGPDGIYLSWLRPDGRRWSRRQRLGPRGPGRLVRLTSDAAETPAALLALREEAPDEITETVAYFVVEGDRLACRFERAFTLPKRRADAADVRFGPAEPAWSFESTEAGPAVVWVRGPRVLTVPGPDGDVRFTIGAETTVFGGAAGPLGSSQRDVYRDFLPARPIDFASVRQGEADVEIDGATDGDLATAWSVPRRALPLTVQLASAAAVRMIRVVPGCAADAETWARRAEVESFRLDVGGTLEIEVDRADPGSPRPGVRAWGEFPLTEAFGRQVVVFLDPPRRAGWVRLTPRRAGNGREPACVAEVSVH